LFIKNKTTEYVDHVKKYISNYDHQKIPISSVFNVKINHRHFLNHYHQIPFSNVTLCFEHFVDIKQIKQKFNILNKKTRDEPRPLKKWSGNFMFDFYNVDINAPALKGAHFDIRDHISQFPICFEKFECLRLGFEEKVGLDSCQKITDEHFEGSPFFERLTLDLRFDFLNNAPIEEQIEQKKIQLSKLNFSNIHKLELTTNKPFWFEDMKWLPPQKKIRLKTLKLNIQNSSESVDKISILKLLSHFDLSTLRKLDIRLFLWNNEMSLLRQDLEIEKWNLSPSIKKLYIVNVVPPTKELPWVKNIVQFKSCIDPYNLSILNFIESMKKLQHLGLTTMTTRRFPILSKNERIINMSGLKNPEIAHLKLNMFNPKCERIRFKISNEWMKTLKSLYTSDCDVISETNDSPFQSLDHLWFQKQRSDSLAIISKKFELSMFPNIKHCKLVFNSSFNGSDHEISFVNQSPKIEKLVIQCKNLYITKCSDKFCPNLKSLDIQCKTLVTSFKLFNDSWVNLKELKIEVLDSPLSCSFLLNRCLDNLMRLEIKATVSELKSWIELLDRIDANESIRILYIEIKKLKLFVPKKSEFEKFEHCVQKIKHKLPGATIKLIISQ